MSQTPPQWKEESKGKRPTAREDDKRNWVYLRLAQNTNGGINYFDERNINPIKTWSRFKEFKSRNDIFWSQIDLKDLFSKAKVGKELLVFFWSHFANKHSVVKLKQIVQKIEQNIVDIRNLSRSMNSFRPSLEKIIEPLEYAILRYKTKYEKIDGDTINVWDIPFYSRLATRERFQEKFNGVFELENVLAGLEYVCFELFGLKIEELPVDDSEDWTKGVLNKKMHVRKLVLYDVDADDDHCEKVGTIYLDLYPRLNKVAGATHFALRHSHRKFNGEYQLPVVFLNTNFSHYFSF